MGRKSHDGGKAEVEFHDRDSRSADRSVLWLRWLRYGDDVMQQALPILVAIAGVGYGMAALVRAWFEGRAALVRAERGDPEPVARRTTFPSILTRPPPITRDEA